MRNVYNVRRRTRTRFIGICYGLIVAKVGSTYQPCFCTLFFTFSPLLRLARYCSRLVHYVPLDCRPNLLGGNCSPGTYVDTSIRTRNSELIAKPADVLTRNHHGHYYKIKSIFSLAMRGDAEISAKRAASRDKRKIKGETLASEHVARNARKL